MMLDLRLAVVDEVGKNPVLAFVDDAGDVVTRVGSLPKRANLVRQWLAEAHRCMGLTEPATVGASADEGLAQGMRPGFIDPLAQD